jgi:hypothetical protein
MAQARSRRPAPDAPRPAASYVRRSAYSIRARHQGIGKTISIPRAERIALCDWAKINGKKIPFSFVGQFKPIGSGAEHHVYHDQQNGLAVKATHTNNFGHSVFAPGAKATPSEYLRRLAWSNLLLGDEFRILGVAFDDEDQIEIVCAHPWIEAHQTRPAPLQHEISGYLARFGFVELLNNPYAPLFYHYGLRLMLADAHDTNIVRDTNGDCAAIDVVIGRPGPALRSQFSLPWT